MLFVDYFKNLKKGEVIILNDRVRWKLDKFILDFYEGKVDHMCVIRANKPKFEWEYTHVHFFIEDLADLLKDIDNPDKKVSVKCSIFGEDFEIVDINENKKHSHYSI